MKYSHEIKLRTTVERETFNRFKILLEFKLDIKLKERVAKCFVLSAVLHGH